MLALLRHGGVFGVEGALLGVPSLFAARVRHCERNAQLLVIAGAGLAKLRSEQPVLHQKLLAANAEQQQSLTALLARRTVLWRGAAGKSSGPSIDTWHR